MIDYKIIKNFEEKQLKELFTSVGWISANYSDRLVRALSQSDTVISAWDGSKLVGLINALLPSGRGCITYDVANVVILRAVE